MKRMLFSQPKAGQFDITMLIMRIGFGILMIPHGYSKLIHFAEKKAGFMSFLGLNSSLSLSLTIFAELFCSLFFIVGLFTRLISIPLLILAIVIVFVAHQGDIFGEGAEGFAFLLVYLPAFLFGPGKYSVDHILFHKKRLPS